MAITRYANQEEENKAVAAGVNWIPETGANPAPTMTSAPQANTGKTYDPSTGQWVTPGATNYWKPTPAVDSGSAPVAPDKIYNPIDPSTGQKYNWVSDADVRRYTRQENPNMPLTAAEEQDIKDTARRDMQDRIDAINKYYDTVVSTTANGVNRQSSGRARALAAASGNLGSDFGNAAMDTVEQQNRDRLAAVNAERAMKQSELYGEVDQRAKQAIADKKAEIEKRQAQFLGKQTAVRDDARSRISSLVSGGMTLNDLSAKEYEQLLADSGLTMGEVSALINQNKTTEKPIEIGGNLVMLNPETGKYEAVYSTPGEDKTKPVTLSRGQQLVDPVTGKVIAEGGETLKFIPASKYQKAGYMNMDTGVFTPTGGGGGSMVETGDGSLSPIPVAPSSPAPIKKTKTFDEFIAEKEQQAGMSFTPEKRQSLMQEYEASQPKTEGGAQLDTSKFDWRVRSIISGTMDVNKLSLTERKALAPQLSQAEAAGLIPSATTDEQRQAFNSMVDRYQKSPLIAASDKMGGYLRTIESAGNGTSTPQKDLNLIYAYIKALDYGESAVREGEIDLGMNTGSIKQELQAKANKLGGTGLLSESQRQNYIAAARELVGEVNGAAKRKENSFKSQAQAAGYGQMWDRYRSGFVAAYDLPGTDAPTGGNPSLRSKYEY